MYSVGITKLILWSQCFDFSFICFLGVVAVVKPLPSEGKFFISNQQIVSCSEYITVLPLGKAIDGEILFCSYYDTQSKVVCIGYIFN